MRAFPGIVSLLLSAALCHACTLCDSESAAAVRDGLFNDQFFATLIKVAAPFPVIAAALYVINSRLPG